MTATIQLDIISDPICPWCYIGKAGLDRALEKNHDHPFKIEWHPFQLNPDMPAGGMDRRTYLETKFGGKENAVKVYGRIEEAAIAAGLEINFEGIKTTPNTIDAHRLIHWAKPPWSPSCSKHISSRAATSATQTYWLRSPQRPRCTPT